MSGGDEDNSCDLGIHTFAFEFSAVLDLLVQVLGLIKGGALDVESNGNVPQQFKALGDLLVFGSKAGPFVPFLNLSGVLPLDLCINAVI